MQLKEELYKGYYKEAALLFQRLNFFLISVAFLISALAVVLCNCEETDNSRCFYMFIVVTGGIVSLVFLWTNYYSSRHLLKKIRDKIYEIEEPGKGFFTTVLPELNPREKVNCIAWMIREFPGIHTILLPIVFLAFFVVLNFCLDYNLNGYFTYSYMGAGILATIFVILAVEFSNR